MTSSNNTNPPNGKANMAPPAPDAASAAVPDRKPFTAFITEARRGVLVAELTDALADVVASVIRHGKKGELTLKLTIKPEGGDGAISVSDNWTAKPPTPPARASLFFADDTGRISRQRIDQPELPLKGLAGGAGTGDDPAAKAEGASS